VWGIYSRERNRNGRSHGTAPSTPVATSETSTSSVGASEGTISPSVQQTATTQDGSTKVPAGSPTSTSQAGGEAVSRPMAASRVPLPPQSTFTTQPVAVSPAPGMFFVVIRAHEDSWISATADGKVVYNDTLAAPGEKAIQARRQILVRAGNIGGLDLFFDGRKLPPQGQSGEVRTLTFGVNGLEVEPLSKPPN
jgi:hypothetical protein